MLQLLRCCLLLGSLFSFYDGGPVCFVKAEESKTIGGAGGAAMYFDGVNDNGRIFSQVNLCGGDNPFGFQDVTVELWYYLMAKDPLASKDYWIPNGVIFDTGIGRGLSLYQDSSGIRFRLENGVDAGQCGESFHAHIPWGERARTTEGFDKTEIWTHLAFVVRTEADGKIKKMVYRNGELFGDTFTKNGLLEYECKESVGYSLGAEENYFVGAIIKEEKEDFSQWPNRCVMDEFRIWTTALSEEQVRSRMHRTLNPAERASPDLLLYWDMEGADPLTVSDRSESGGFDLHLGRSGFGDHRVARLPTRIPSSAPLVGSKQKYNTRDYKDVAITLKAWHPATQNIVEVSDEGAGVTGRILSLPSSGVLQVEGGSIITATPFDLLAGQTLKFVPSVGTGGTSVVFSFTVTIAGYEASEVEEAHIAIQENRRPRAGTAGRSIHFGGDNKDLDTDRAGTWGLVNTYTWRVHEYQAANNGETIVGGGPMTLEYWSYMTLDDFKHPMLRTLAVFGLSYNCPFGDATARCEGMGNFAAKPSTQELVIVYGAVARKKFFVPMAQHIDKWLHIAFTSCGADPACTDPVRVYFDGEVVAEFDGRNYNWKPLNSLSVGAQNNKYHLGIVDEFRLWSTYRTQQQLKAHMYSTLPAGGASTNPGLELYYPFNGPEETTAITASDASGNGYPMIFGGCFIIDSPLAKGIPRNDQCYQHDTSLIVDDVLPIARPPRVTSTAPLGGHMDPIQLHSADNRTSAIEFQLPGVDADGDAITFHVTSLPTRGKLVDTLGDSVVVGKALPMTNNRELSVTFIADPLVGGWPYATFTYEVRDEELSSFPQEVPVDVLCMPGYELGNGTAGASSYTCEKCPAGTYNPRYGETCNQCPQKTVLAETGKSSCVCDAGYEWQVEGEYCLQVGIPCSMSGCGSFAVCGSDGQYCSCKSGYEMKAGVYRDIHDKRDFNCELALASSGEQRVFWVVSSYTNMISLILVSATLYQFTYNSATKSPVVRSYLAVLIPDAVMAVVYLPFHIVNALRGHEIDSGSCTFIAFITYGIVIATFSGPMAVSYITYRKIYLVVNNKWNTQVTSRKEMACILTAPWLLGFVMAAIVYSQNLLGSYRGLICYATRMDKFWTGGATLLFLLLSCCVTTYYYVRVSKLVFEASKGRGGGTTRRVGANENDEDADDDDRHEHARQQSSGVMNRGLKLVGVLFASWSLFTVAGTLGWMQVPVPVVFESIGAILITLQPSVDSYMILSMQPIWQDLKNSAITHGTKKVKGAKQQASPADTTSYYSTGTVPRGRAVVVPSAGSSTTASNDNNTVSRGGSTTDEAREPIGTWN